MAASLVGEVSRGCCAARFTAWVPEVCARWGFSSPWWVRRGSNGLEHGQRGSNPSGPGWSRAASPLVSAMCRPRAAHRACLRRLLTTCPQPSGWGLPSWAGHLGPVLGMVSCGVGPCNNGLTWLSRPSSSLHGFDALVAAQVRGVVAWL